MKTKQNKIDARIRRLEKLKQETILRHTDEIDFEQDLSLYDVMMNCFVKGELDSVFDVDLCLGMNELDKRQLFSLTHEFMGLCFVNGDVDYWLDSLENIPISDYNLIAYSIFESFEFLLELAKNGGRAVLELLVSLRASDELRNVALVNYLKNSCVDDKVLSVILLEMSKNNSYYNIFTDEQKGILLSYPEGTLYAYDNDEIKITSPLVLGVQIYNNVNPDRVIAEISDNNIQFIISTLNRFYREEKIDFDDEVMSLVGSYRDYVRKNNVVLNTNVSNVSFDEQSSLIQDAWLSGDEMLGSMFETPYTGGGK